MNDLEALRLIRSETYKFIRGSKEPKDVLIKIADILLEYKRLNEEPTIKNPTEEHYKMCVDC